MIFHPALYRPVHRDAAATTAPHPVHAEARGMPHRLRPVPRQMAPERCVTYDDCVSAQHVVLVGTDLDGTVRIKVELAREDVSSWWVKVIRHWLAWRYNAAEIRLVR